MRITTGTIYRNNIYYSCYDRSLILVLSLSVYFSFSTHSQCFTNYLIIQNHSLWNNSYFSSYETCYLSHTCYLSFSHNAYNHIVPKTLHLVIHNLQFSFIMTLWTMKHCLLSSKCVKTFTPLIKSSVCRLLLFLTPLLGYRWRGNPKLCNRFWQQPGAPEQQHQQ